MLISSDLSSLGKALHSDSPNLETKGVASFRSPVSTINAHRKGKEITHDTFVQAVRDQFGSAYPGDMEVTVVREEEVDIPKVWDGVKDIKVGCAVQELTIVLGMEDWPNARVYEQDQRRDVLWSCCELLLAPLADRRRRSCTRAMLSSTVWCLSSLRPTPKFRQY